MFIHKDKLGSTSEYSHKDERTASIYWTAQSNHGRDHEVELVGWMMYSIDPIHVPDMEANARRTTTLE
jgi:hypothetical protein